MEHVSWGYLVKVQLMFCPQHVMADGSDASHSRRSGIDPIASRREARNGPEPTTRDQEIGGDEAAFIREENRLLRRPCVLGETREQLAGGVPW